MWGVSGAEREALQRRIDAQCLEIQWLRDRVEALALPTLLDQTGSAPDPYPEALDRPAPPRFPPEVQAAIDAKAGDHTGIRADLETWTESALAQSGSDPEEVVAAILLGADLSDI